MYNTIEYKSNLGTRYFIYDDTKINTEEKINKALSETDMGAVVDDCINLSEKEYNFIYAIVQDYKNEAYDIGYSNGYDYGSDVTREYYYND